MHDVLRFVAAVFQRREEKEEEKKEKAAARKRSHDPKICAQKRGVETVTYFSKGSSRGGEEEANMIMQGDGGRAATATAKAMICGP